MVRKDRLFAVCLIILSIACFVITLDFPTQAAYYPRAVLILMVFLSIIIFIKAKPEDTVDIRASVKEFFTHRKLLYVIVSLFAMFFLMKPVGLYIELPVFVFALLQILGFESKKKSVLIALGLTIIIYLLFSILLGVRIPMGILKGIL